MILQGSQKRGLAEEVTVIIICFPHRKTFPKTLNTQKYIAGRCETIHKDISTNMSAGADL